MSYKLESFLECSVCLEHFNDGNQTPIVLGCGHTFCKTCVLRIYDGFRCQCPNCRTFIAGRPETRNLLVLGLVAEARAAEERNRFDQCVARGVALLLADPVFCRTRALFVDVLSPEVGMVLGYNGGCPTAMATDTRVLDRFVRLILAVCNHASTAHLWQYERPRFYDSSDQSLHLCALTLYEQTDMSDFMKRLLLCAFLQNLPALAPLEPHVVPVPRPVVVVNDVPWYSPVEEDDDDDNEPADYAHGRSAATAIIVE